MPRYVTDDRRAAIAQAVAKAMVFKYQFAHKRPDLVALYWTGEGHPPTRRQMEYIEAHRLARQVLAEGRLDVGQSVGSLTPDFLHGVRLAHGIRRQSGHYWLLDASRNPELVADLSEMPFTGHVARKGAGSLRYLNGCVILRIPPTDWHSRQLFAGILAGSALADRDGVQWLSAPFSEKLVEILGYWKVPLVEVETKLVSRRRRDVQFSPFYGLLLAKHMPTESAGRFLGIRRPAMCPKLPLALWHIVYGKEGVRFPPKSGALPYMIGSTKRSLLGLSRRDVYWWGVERGLGNIQLEVKALMDEWRASPFTECK